MQAQQGIEGELDMLPNFISVQQDNAVSSNGTTAHQENLLQPHYSNKHRAPFNRATIITAMH